MSAMSAASNGNKLKFFVGGQFVGGVSLGETTMVFRAGGKAVVGGKAACGNFVRSGKSPDGIYHQRQSRQQRIHHQRQL